VKTPSLLNANYYYSLAVSRLHCSIISLPTALEIVDLQAISLITVTKT